MLHNTKDLYGYKLSATDGDIGRVRDFYFDDKTWVLRYLVADTGTWLTGRLVLLSPHAFGPLDDDDKTLEVNLTRKQIENGPTIEAHKPVSRQYEVDYYRYYGWPAYWDGGALWGMGGYPVVLPPTSDELEAHVQHHHRDDKHLQSAASIKGYPIQTTDGPIGHVTGFMVDDKSWAIRELVVETGHWYAGKEILIAPSKVTRISYEESQVYVHLTKADIERTGEHKVVHAGAAIPPVGGFPKE
ncbi:MAG: PRC-barrel domain-containing protein [Verrucomicrobia bacterium]|nr:PRC-barrel domain-containing protein [Verrucomicrobiota bacterium]